MEEQAYKQESPWVEAAPYLQLISLFGIPAAGCIALGLWMQVPRFIYGQANPFLIVGEFASLLVVVVLVLILRACLKLPSAPVGLYRDILDFLAMAKWHPAVLVALAGLLILPHWWMFHTGGYWFFSIYKFLGSRVLQSSDFRDGLDKIAVLIQLPLIGGVPFLFILHMICRRKPKNRVLPWILVPLLFVGTAVIIVLIGAAVHS